MRALGKFVISGTKLGWLWGTMHGYSLLLSEIIVVKTKLWPPSSRSAALCMQACKMRTGNSETTEVGN